MKKAFTLIELLVVIAIIAILAAILFPVFAQAKLAAKKTAGLNAAKQIGLGLNIYVNDYDDVLLPYRWNVGDAGPDVNPFYLSLPVGDARRALYDTAGLRTRKASFFNNMLEPYIKNNDIWKNQSNPEAWVNYQDKGAYDPNFFGYGGQNSYAANNYLLKSNVGVSYSAVAEVSNTLVFVDATYYNTLPAQPVGGFCKITGYDPTGGNANSSYYHYWKHLGNSKLNFNALGNSNPDDVSNVATIRQVENRYNGVLNVARADSSAKAINAKALIYDLRNKGPEQSIWSPTKTACEL